MINLVFDPLVLENLTEVVNLCNSNASEIPTQIPTRWGNEHCLRTVAISHSISLHIRFLYTAPLDVQGFVPRSPL